MDALLVIGYFIAVVAGWTARTVWVSFVAIRQEIVWFERRMKEAADA